MRRFGPPLVLREPPRACLGEKRRDDEMLRQKSLKEKIVFLGSLAYNVLKIGKRAREKNKVF